MADDTSAPPKSKGGRPRVEQPLSAPVSAWVRPNEYERLVKMAHLRDQTVSALVRSLLITKLR